MHVTMCGCGIWLGMNVSCSQLYAGFVQCVGVGVLYNNMCLSYLLHGALVLQYPTRQNTCGKTGCQPTAPTCSWRMMSRSCLRPPPLSVVPILAMTTFTAAVAAAAAPAAIVTILVPAARACVVTPPVSAMSLMPVLIWACL